jgi:hypothetical protein
MPQTVNTRDPFVAKQETLIAALTETRSVIPHAVAAADDAIRAPTWMEVVK